MKYVCTNVNCLKLVDEKDIIRMPFDTEEFWCPKCHDEWRNEDE